MQIKSANPNFFVVKINKELQLQNKEGNSIIKRAATYTFGKGGMQHGEIISIGKLAKLIIPQAKIGGFLLFSWKVEYVPQESKKPNMALIHEDEEYNYYTITISEFKRRDCDCYAYFDNEIFITHPSFVIIHPKEETAQEIIQRESGIYCYNNWRMTEDEIMYKINQNTQHIYSLSITHASLLQTRESESYPIKRYMQALEEENRRLSELIHGKEVVEEYTVAFCNPIHKFKKGDVVFGYNIFFLQPITINDKNYFIGKQKFVYARKLKVKSNHHAPLFSNGELNIMIPETSVYN